RQAISGAVGETKGGTIHVIPQDSVAELVKDHSPVICDADGRSDVRFSQSKNDRNDSTDEVTIRPRSCRSSALGIDDVRICIGERDSASIDRYWKSCSRKIVCALEAKVFQELEEMIAVVIRVDGCKP